MAPPGAIFYYVIMLHMASPIHTTHSLSSFDDSRGVYHTGGIQRGSKHNLHPHHRAVPQLSRMQLWNEIVMVFLAVVSVLLLTLEITLDQQHEYRPLAEAVDTIVAAIFLCEFIWHFYKARHKKHFLMTRWWELLAAIPLSNTATQAMRSIRVLKIFELIRILRAVRLASRLGVVSQYTQRFEEETHMAYIGIMLALFSFAGTLSFYIMEHDTNPKVGTLFDSFWWTMSTMSTVGYGDIIPLTVGGRVVGIILMLVGAGLLGIFTAAVATYMIRQREGFTR